MIYIFLGEPAAASAAASGMATVVSSTVVWLFSVPTVVACALLFHKMCWRAWRFTKSQWALWVLSAFFFLVPSWPVVSRRGQNFVTESSLAVVWEVRINLHLFLLICDPFSPTLTPCSWGKRLTGVIGWDGTYFPPVQSFCPPHGGAGAVYWAFHWTFLKSTSRYWDKCRKL